MEHWIEVQTGDEDFGMQFIERIIPPFTNKKISVCARQDIQITKAGGAVVKDSLGAEKEFWIAGRAFTIDLTDVYSVSPGDNESGNFSNQLPHITLKKRTLPWEYETEDGEPWLALITVTDGEHSAKDISIAELKRNEEQAVYFPVQAQPKVYLEKDSDLCHVIDVKKDVFLNIMPQKGERSLLTHGKFLNLLQKTDETVEMDGYFATVIGGRFIPTKAEETVKSTIHLVSVLGYEKLDQLPQNCKVRLVSLHHWNVFSKSDEEAGFVSLMTGLACGTMRIDTENELLAHGYVPKEHLFRTGERTVSVYRGPLVPFPAPALEAEGERMLPKTADGALVFNKETALFDASYSTAWQMGRLLTVQNKAIASAIVKWRKGTETSLRRMSAKGFLKGIMEGSAETAELAEKGVKELLTKMGGADKEV